MCCSSDLLSNEKTPVGGDDSPLRALPQEIRECTMSVLNSSGGEAFDRNELVNAESTNNDMMIGIRADFRLMAITDVFFKKITSFHSIYIDLFENLCDNI